MPRRSLAIFLLVSLFIICLPTSAAFSRQQAPWEQSTIGFLPFIQVATTAPPNTVTLKSYHSYFKAGDLYILGEMANTTSTTVFNARVVPLIQDANRQEGSKLVDTLIKRLAPNQTTPFKVIISGLAEPLTKLSLMYVYQSSLFPEYQSAQVTVKSVDTTLGTTFSGSVVNNNLSPLTEIGIVATFYDTTGQVVDTELLLLRGTVLPPQASINFQMQTRPVPAEYNTYRVQAEGILQQSP